MPEHFNLPWHLCQEENMYAQDNASIEWIDFPGGTGAMVKALESRELDMASLLTEGAVTAISNGLSARIIHTYVQSPLIWGVHVPANSPLADSQHPWPQIIRVAVSRFGSGSHLMAYVWAKKNGIDTDRLQFVVTGGLEGAKEALPKGEAEVFLWEKYTTAPFVNENIFARRQDCPTPWSCFQLVVHKDVLANYEIILKEVINTVANRSRTIGPKSASRQPDCPKVSVRQKPGSRMAHTNPLELSPSHR